LINIKTCINASNWKNEAYQHYVFYSPDQQVIAFLKQQIIAQGTTFNCFKIGFQHFYKPFACLVINTLTGEFFLARDHFGLEPFYYTIISGERNRLCFGSNLPDILAHVKNPVQDKQQISNVLMDICTSSLEYTDNTFYENVFRVTPGHVLQLNLAQKHVEHRHAFWVLEPGTPKIHYASDADYDAHFAFLLQEAIQVCCQQSPDSVAMEFSGGLDTAAIFTACNTEGITPQLFMHVGEVDDERRYGDQLLHESKSTHPIHYVNADEFDVIAVLDQYKQWFAGGAPYLFFMFAQNIHQAVSQQGCKLLLSGFGGDECVSSHAPLRTYGADVGYKALWNELRTTHNNDSTVRRQLKTLQLTQPHLLYSIQCIKSCISSLARRQVGVHYKPYRSLQERESDWLQGRLSHHVRMRVEYSAVLARYMGFTYQYPLLYPPLVEFCFSLPPEQKRRLGQSRLLMRRYLAQHVPSGLFNAHKKCGDILPGTMPKCQQLYEEGKLNDALFDLPYNSIYGYIKKYALVSNDRLFHVDLLRYMFK
jgi:asparagine synthase (glutamine-hydrolysing)